MPVSFAKVTSVNEKIFMHSGIDGYIDYGDLKKLNGAEELTIEHVAFESQSITLDEFSARDTVILNYRDRILPTFDITASEKSPKYIELKGCARSYQRTDEINTYYFDGIGRYLYKVKNFKTKYGLDEARIMKNKSLLSDRDDHKVDLIFRAIAMPELDAGFLPSLILKDKSSRVDTLSEKQYRIYNDKDNITVSVVFDQEYVTLNIQDGQVVGVRRAFQTEVSTISRHLIYIFRLTQGNLHSISGFRDLVYANEFSEFEVKHNNGNQADNIQVYNEFFVEEVKAHEAFPQFVTRPGRGAPPRSNYSREFWNECDCELYRSLDKNLTIGLTTEKEQ